MKNVISSAFVAVLVAAGLSVAATGKMERTAGASVSFTGKGPAGFKMVGTTDQIAVADDGAKLTLTVPVETLKTGNGLRDKHMTEKYLETGKFPTAILALDKGQLKFPKADGEKIEGKATGQLTLHGVTRPQEVSYSMERAGGIYKIASNFKMNFKEHGVDVPSYLGVTVKPDVEVAAALNLK